MQKAFCICKKLFAYGFVSKLSAESMEFDCNFYFVGNNNNGHVYIAPAVQPPVKSTKNGRLLNDGNHLRDNRQSFEANVILHNIGKWKKLQNSIQFKYFILQSQDKKYRVKYLGVSQKRFPKVYKYTSMVPSK